MVSESQLINPIEYHSLTNAIKVTVKYIFVVLRADNEGEGGTFS